MGVSKVILNGNTLMDVTQDTVAANNLVSGNQATGADGNRVVGAFPDPVTIAHGGTGAATASEAAENLSVLGLGKLNTAIPANADLHAYTTPGVYSVASTAVAETLVNAPTAKPGTVRVWNALGDSKSSSDRYYIVGQEYVDAFGNAYYHRGIVGSKGAITWMPWNSPYLLGVIPEEIPENGDFDDYVVPGSYAVTTDAIASTLANCPSKYAGKLTVSYTFFSGNSWASNSGQGWRCLMQEWTNVIGRRYSRYAAIGAGNVVTWDSHGWYMLLTGDYGISSDEVTLTIASVAAGASGSVSASAVRNGYTNLGIMSIEGTNSSGLTYSDWYIDSNNNVCINYRNDTSSAKSNVTLKVKVLRIRTSYT